MIIVYLQGRVIARSKELLAHDQPSLGVRVESLDVVEDLGSRLAGTNDSDTIRRILLVQDLRSHVGELRGVKDTRVLGREALGERRLATGSDKNVTASERLDLASLAVMGLNLEALDNASLLVDGGDGGNLVVILDDVVKEGRTPAEIVLVLGTGRQEGIQVGKVDKAALTVEVVEKGELGTGIAEGGQVLDEGDLHLGSGEEHAGVPSETGLLLEEENLGSSAVGAELLTGGNGVVHGDGDGQRRGAEADTDKIILGVGRRSLQVLGTLLVNSAGVNGAGDRASAGAVYNSSVGNVDTVGVGLCWGSLMAVEGNFTVGSHDDGRTAL